MVRNLLACVLAGATLFAAAATAAPLAYDEASSGDLGGQTLLLDAGTNTITGTMRFVFDDVGLLQAAESDLDAFRVTFATDLRLVSLTLASAFAPIDDLFATRAALQWGLGDGDGALATTCQVLVGNGCLGVPAIPVTGGALFSALMPLQLAVAGGFYAIDVLLFLGGEFDPGFGGDYRYVLTFDLIGSSSARPLTEPGTLALLAAALFGLAGPLRRRAF